MPRPDDMAIMSGCGEPVQLDGGRDRAAAAKLLSCLRAPGRRFPGRRRPRLGSAPFFPLTLLVESRLSRPAGGGGG